jgi:predicted metal-dependent hydrolase
MAKEARPRNLPLFTAQELEERRPILLAGISQYNDGNFFEAHETWEDVWLQTPLPTRDHLQGLIQVAAAFVHLVRHEYPGIVRLLDAALEKLHGAPDELLGVDARRFEADVRRARDELAALGAERFESWDRARIPRIHLLARPRRRRRAST